MCGRYTGWIDDCEELKTIYTKTERAYPGTVLKSGEIFPTNRVPLLTVQDTVLCTFAATWGYPGFDKSEKNVIINARSESITGKRLFADSFAYRRCVIPSTGYYEWSKDTHQKYYFNLPENKGILFLGGIYKLFDDGLRFVILTAKANDSVSDIHHRMPVVIRREALRDWLKDVGAASQYNSTEMPAMIRRPA